MLCWCATSSARAGTWTGFLLKDLTLDKIPVDTEVPTLAGSFTKPGGTVSEQDWRSTRANGALVTHVGATRVEAQDRADRTAVAISSQRCGLRNPPCGRLDQHLRATRWTRAGRASCATTVE
ncbi:unnamed protein product, partial [Scytosiphon promiscuus]